MISSCDVTIMCSLPAVVVIAASRFGRPIFFNSTGKLANGTGKYRQNMFPEVSGAG